MQHFIRNHRVAVGGLIVLLLGVTLAFAEHFRRPVVFSSEAKYDRGARVELQNGATYNIKSGATVTLESGGTMTVSSGGTLTLASGATVNFNANFAGDVTLQEGDEIVNSTANAVDIEWDAVGATTLALGQFRLLSATATAAMSNNHYTIFTFMRAANDTGGSATTTVDFAHAKTTGLDPTGGTEDTKVEFYVKTAGTDTEVLDLLGSVVTVPVAFTATGKATANGELEANADVDINLTATTHEIAVTQTNTTGAASTPMMSITDSRTGANANSAAEATLVINAAGTHAFYVQTGISQFDKELEANENVDINLQAATDYIRITQTNAAGTSSQPMMSIVDSRTGANANSAAEASFVINAAGTHALYVQTGIAQFDKELEANENVDINLQAIADYVRITQTNTTGTSSEPLCSIVDARTGANANSAGEATLVINGSGTHGLYVQGGIVALATNLTVGSSTTSTDKDTGGVVVECGVGIEENLNIGGVFKSASTTDATTKDTGCVIVEGGIGVEKAIFIGSSTASTGKDTGAIICEGGAGIEGNLHVGGTINSTGVVSIANTTVSASKDTGCLIVEGGVGVEEDVYAGGQIQSVAAITAGGQLNASTNVVVSATTVSSSKDTGSIVTEGGIGVEEDVYAGGQIISVAAMQAGGAMTCSTTLQVNATTVSSSKDTGSAIFEGGIGVEEDVYAGGQIQTVGAITSGGQLNASTNIVCSSTTATTTKDTGSIVTEGGIGMEGVLFVGSATVSSSKDTGCAIFEGGIGVEEDGYFGGQVQTVAAITSGGQLNASTNIVCSATTVSSSKDTGSIVTEGGVGAEEDVYAGGNIHAVGGQFHVGNAAGTGSHGYFAILNYTQLVFVATYTNSIALSPDITNTIDGDIGS